MAKKKGSVEEKSSEERFSELGGLLGKLLDPKMDGKNISFNGCFVVSKPTSADSHHGFRELSRYGTLDDGKKLTLTRIPESSSDFDCYRVRSRDDNSFVYVFESINKWRLEIGNMDDPKQPPYVSLRLIDKPIDKEVRLYLSRG
ncbi:hypothetical protein HOD75_02565 [archaeon]|jgi:hypothetical protein|nr:hypothetical protein [archaeon]MBT4241760.1 hypothetical protein [archaeon]MBT4418308.1 hypothetical protein [archaeon]